MPTSGSIIFASDINAAVAAVAAVKVLKPSDTARASNTTSSADPDLVLTVPAGTYYTVVANISFNGDTTAKKKGGLYVPSGGSFYGTIRAQGSAATTTSGPIITNAQVATGGFIFGTIGAGSANDLTALVVGVLYTGSGGSTGWQWAQNVSSATATTVRANSFITLIPLA